MQFTYFHSYFNCGGYFQSDLALEKPCFTRLLKRPGDVMIIRRHLTAYLNRPRVTSYMTQITIRVAQTIIIITIK